MIVDLIVISLSISFAVSILDSLPFLDRWLAYPLIRGAITLVLSIGAALVHDHRGWDLVFLSTSSAFAALILLLIGERLVTTRPVQINRHE